MKFSIVFCALLACVALSNAGTVEQPQAKVNVASLVKALDTVIASLENEIAETPNPIVRFAKQGTLKYIEFLRTMLDRYGQDAVETVQRLLHKLQGTRDEPVRSRREAQDTPVSRHETIEQLRKLLANFLKLEAAAINDFVRVVYRCSVNAIRTILNRLERAAENQANEEVAIENARVSVEQLEDILASIDTRGAVDTVISGIELVKMIVFRTRQMVATIEDTARHMEEQGHKNVADSLRQMSAAMVEAKNKMTDLIARLPAEKRAKIASVINSGLSIVETSINYVDKLGIIKGTKDASTIVSGIKSLVDAFNGQEPVEGDQKNLEEILKVPGIPDLIKACRTFLEFSSKILKLVGQGDSAVMQYINTTLDVINATLEVYKEAIDQAQQTSSKSWKDTAIDIKDRFLNLFKKSKKA